MSRQYTLQRAPKSRNRGIHIDYAAELNEQQLAFLAGIPSVRSSDSFLARNEQDAQPGADTLGEHWILLLGRRSALR